MNDLTTLHERDSELSEQIERLELGRLIRLKESLLGTATYREAYPDYLTARDIRRETGWGDTMLGPAASRADDYANGDCRPIYQDEQTLQELRGMGRFLALSDELASCVLKNLRNYTVGEGSEVGVTSRTPDGERLVGQVRAFLDEFLDLNDFTGEAEAAALLDSVVDGDTLLWLKARGKGAPELQFVGGEHIMQPSNPREVEDFIGTVGLDWKYGVATSHGNTAHVMGYFVNWYGNAGSDWDFVLNDEAVFFKRNVPRPCKRGISDFYVPFNAMSRGNKLFDNAVLGAAMQAAIVGIKKAPAGTQEADLTSALTSRLTHTGDVYKGDGTRVSGTFERWIGGTMLHTGNMDFMYGPMGTPQGPTYVKDVYQAVARKVGSRWCMPEYMISGDASNANYSSSLVAESPFIKEIKHEQGRLAQRVKRLLWRAVKMAAHAGRFGGMTADDLYEAVAIEVSYPNPESRKPLEAEQVMDSQQRAGVLSARTRAARSGLDYDQEQRAGAKREEAPSESLRQAAVSAALESVESTEEALAILENLSEDCGTGAGGFKHGNTCAAGGGGGGKSPSPPKQKSVDELLASLKDPANQGGKRAKFRAKVRKQLRARGYRSPEQIAGQAEAAQRAARLDAAIDEGRKKIAATELSGPDRILARDAIEDAESPREARSYSNAVAEWKSARPAHAAIAHTVAKLREKGFVLEEKGANGSFYGTAPDGRSVRVADHLGFDAHDIEFTYESTRVPLKGDVERMIKELEL